MFIIIQLPCTYNWWWQYMPSQKSLHDRIIITLSIMSDSWDDTTYLCLWLTFNIISLQHILPFLFLAPTPYIFTFFASFLNVTFYLTSTFTHFHYLNSTFLASLFMVMNCIRTAKISECLDCLCRLVVPCNLWSQLKFTILSSLLSNAQKKKNKGGKSEYSDVTDER